MYVRAPSTTPGYIPWYWGAVPHPDFAGQLSNDLQCRIGPEMRLSFTDSSGEVLLLTVYVPLPVTSRSMLHPPAPTPSSSYRTMFVSGDGNTAWCAGSSSAKFMSECVGFETTKVAHSPANYCSRDWDLGVTVKQVLEEHLRETKDVPPLYLEVRSEGTHAPFTAAGKDAAEWTVLHRRIALEVGFTNGGYVPNVKVGAMW